MALVPITAPAVEPLSLAEAKSHLRIDGNDDNMLLASLILTSRLHIEAALGLALVTQSWAWFLDKWPRGLVLTLPMRPVQSITAVRVRAADDSALTIAPEFYDLDGKGVPPRLALSRVSPLPLPGRHTNGIEIDFVAGFGATAASVPAPVRQALLLLVAHWYEHRAPFELAGGTKPIPPSVSELLMPYRQVRA